MTDSTAPKSVADIAQHNNTISQAANAASARTFDQFIRMAEDGKLNADLSEKLRAIAAELNNHVLAFGGKPKATLNVAFEFKLDGGLFEIQSDFKVTMPKVKRNKTVAWTTANNDFTPQNPRQGHLFDGPRNAYAGDTEPRRV